MRALPVVVTSIVLLVLPGCAAAGGPVEPLISTDWQVAVFEKEQPSGHDILGLGRVVDLGGGCVGVDLDLEDRVAILAVPNGSSMDSAGRITVPEGDTGGPLTFSVGDHIEFENAGFVRPSRVLWEGLTVGYPEGCPASLETWLLLP
jgi:hypothetical protein